MPASSSRPAPFPVPDDLDAILAQCWARLRRAAIDRRHGWHLTTLASCGLDGTPSARLVVFRAVEPAQRLFRIHTDLRSGKIAEIAADPRASLLFYDPQTKQQLRVSGVATMHSDDAVADQAWAATRLFSRRCYLAPIGPGAESDEPTSGLPDGFESRNPDQAESEAGRPHFAAIRLEAQRLEWLHLAASGHRRAGYDWRDGAWQGRWLVP